MAVADKYKWRYVFHFTDVRNLDSIIKNGLLCTNVKIEKGIEHINIANANIQERRAQMEVPVGPRGKVHDYVPFYISSINPMLLSQINRKNVDQNLIIYLCIKIQRLDGEDVVFTDASANTSILPNFYTETADLDKLNWLLIDDKKWKCKKDDDRHHKMAEALIYRMVDISDIDAILVYNDHIKQCVEKIFENNKTNCPSVIFDYDSKVTKYSFYYTKFFLKGQESQSLVTGPLTLKGMYHNLIEGVRNDRKTKKDSYHYFSVNDLVKAIEDDISVLPELNAIVGLKQEYPPHNDSVDEHTNKVVNEIRNTEYYNTASEDLKSVLELAAYLHDIGKGPKEKWQDYKMTRAYPDHPADSIPMLARILTEEIDTLSDDEIRRICLMVMYHDIIGDCMNKGRNKQQIVDLIEDEDDLEMLFAISIADATAIDEGWGMEIAGWKDALVNEIMKLKKP